MSTRPVRFSIDSAWFAWHEGKDAAAREWLVVHYASLVKFVAGRLAAGLPRSVDTADLVSAGVFGLMGAIDKFDPSQGAKFETYSIPRIRGAILDGLRALDWVPRSVRAHSQQIQNAIRDLELRSGGVPQDEEIAEHLKISLDEFHSWLSDIAAGSVGPLDHVALEASPARGTNETQPGRALEEDELRTTMRAEIRKLPERERTVLVLYYDEGLTLSEIGEVIGVTEARISQIHTKAILQLRSRLQAAGMT